MARTPEGLERRKTRDREYKRQLREQNRALFNEKRRDYYARNAEKVQEKLRAYRAENLELTKEWQRKSWAKHAEQRHADQKRYREQNQEKVKAALKRFHANNPEYERERAKKPKRRAQLNVAHRTRKARVRGAEGHYKLADILRQHQEQNGLCVCGKSLENFHIDHIIPISKGGSNWPWNLALLCPTCNRKKWNRLPSWEYLFQVRPNLIGGCANVSTV